MANRHQDFIANLATHEPVKLAQRHQFKRSSVSIVLREYKAELQVLMIKRAERQGDPWSGHMAFPGGRVEAGDTNILETAVRETREELAFDPERSGSLITRLSDLQTPMRVSSRPQMVVSAFVFWLEQSPLIEPNEEVAAYHWIPVNLFADSQQRSSMIYPGVSTDLPCYYYQGECIWGLSLQMIDEMMSRWRISNQ